ncbi:hypothetical protein ACVW0I_007789 [Bradyrhizobium sp. LM6.11]
MRWLTAKHSPECCEPAWQRHSGRNHFSNVPIVLGLSTIERGLELGRQQVFQRRHEYHAVGRLHRVVDATKSDMSEKGNFHRARGHIGQDDHRIGRILKDGCAVEEAELRADVPLVQWSGAKEVEIERLSMSELERHGGAAIEDESQTQRRSK